MTIYTVTTLNWNDPAFWSGISASTADHTLDFSGLSSAYTVTVDKTNGRITVNDGGTSFVVGESGYVGPPAADTTMAAGTFLDFFNQIFLPDGGSTHIGDAGNETVVGGDGNDLIDGGAGDDSLSGGLGADTLIGGEGNNTLDGGGWADSITAGSGNDFGYGGAGDDTIALGAGDDYLQGDSGDDSLMGEAGADTIYGGSGADTLEGGSGNDYLDGQDGADVVYGGDGDDTLEGGWDGSNDTVYGGAGNDDVYMYTGDDSVFGGDGNDQIASGAGNDSAQGDAGNDIIVGYDGNDTLVGGTGIDTLSGGAGAGADSVLGGDDQDNLYGYAGDTIDGGEGGIDNDTLFVTNVDVINYDTAESGTISFTTGGSLTFSNIETITQMVHDGIVQGTSGDDGIGHLYIDADGEWIDNNDATGFSGSVGHDDYVLAGDGNDNVWGLTGDDTIFGEAGNDSLRGGDGQDSIVGGDGDDTLDGGYGIDTLEGGLGNDSLTGNQDADSLVGGDGNDWFSGWGGADTIYGDAGNDTIYGGGGGDSIFGGEGADLIGQHQIFGADTIEGGETGLDEDTITFEGSDSAVDVNLTGSEAGTFTQTGYETDVSQFIQIENFALSDFDDTLEGGSNTADMEIDAGAGNDSVVGGSGADSIEGGAGFDSLLGGDGDDTLLGGGDNDSLSGGDGADYLDGGTGTTYYESGLGADTIEDTVGSFGVASYVGSGSAVNIDLTDALSETGGWAEGDTLIGVEQIDGSWLYDDVIIGDSNVELIKGWGGDDTLSGAASLWDMTIEGGTGDDSITGSGNNDSLMGEAGADTIRGGAGNDTILGGEGDDWLVGGLGDDSLLGGDGNDILTGDTGSDTLDGGADADRFDIWAGDNSTTVIGGEGGTDSDIMWLISSSDGYAVSFDGDETGDATLSDGTAVDFSEIEQIWGSAGADTIDASGSNAAVTLTGGNGDDDFIGSSAADSLWGDSGSDTLDGGLGNDTLAGGNDNDSLMGGAGADQLSGEGGDDTLVGGTGNDTLIGGGGDDTFNYTPGDGLDTISDFNFGNSGTLSDGDNTNNDFIDLSGYYENIWELYADYADDNVLNQSNATTLTGKAVDYSDNTEFASGEGIAFTGASADNSSFTIENTGVVCFTADTLVLTPAGEVPIQRLRPGDKIVTRDNGVQPLIWSAARRIDGLELAKNPALRPIFIAPELIGAHKRLLVSPQHGMVIRREDGDETLVRARHLARLKGGQARIAYGRQQVVYFHLMFEAHQIIYANGAPSESFYPGPQALGALAPAPLRELTNLFPDLISASQPEAEYGDTARRFVRFKELPNELGALKRW